MRNLNHERPIGTSIPKRKPGCVREDCVSVDTSLSKATKFLLVVVDPDVAGPLGHEIGNHAGARADVQECPVADRREFSPQSIDDRLRTEVGLLEVVDARAAQQRVLNAARE